MVDVTAVYGNGILDRINAGAPSRVQGCAPSENDDSVTLRITYGPFEFFTGGDIADKADKRSFRGRCTSSPRPTWARPRGSTPSG